MFLVVYLAKYILFNELGVPIKKTLDLYPNGKSKLGRKTS
jgi:hypothetical protein